MERKKISKRKQQAIQTRRDLYNTAIALFAEHGYDNVTVDEICHQSGFTKGAFYNHFASKDQIFIEEWKKIDIFLQGSDMFSGSLSKMSSREKLIKHSLNIMDYIQMRGKAVMKVVYQSQLRGDRKISSMTSTSRPLYKLTNVLVKEGQEKGELRDDISSDKISDAILICLRGIIFDWFLHDGRYELKEKTAEIVILILDGLKPRRSK